MTASSTPCASKGTAAAVVFSDPVLCCQIGPHDLLIMMRPTGLPANAYQPLTVQLAGDVGEHWDPKQYRRRRDAPTGVHCPLLGLKLLSGFLNHMQQPLTAGPFQQEFQSSLRWYHRLHILGKRNMFTQLGRLCDIIQRHLWCSCAHSRETLLLLQCLRRCWEVRFELAGHSRSQRHTSAF